MRSGGNDSNMRTIVMWAFRHFSPTTANIVARLTHTDDLFSLYETCRRLCEEGLLEKDVHDDDIHEPADISDIKRRRLTCRTDQPKPFHEHITLNAMLSIYTSIGCRSAWVGHGRLRITSYGKTCTPAGPTVNTTKLSIFRGLVDKEQMMNKVINTLFSQLCQHSRRAMCVYEIMLLTNRSSTKPTNFYEIQSAMSRLMADGIVEQVGPLYIVFGHARCAPS
jgi:hypothetical protein